MASRTAKSALGCIERNDGVARKRAVKLDAFLRARLINRGYSSIGSDRTSWPASATRFRSRDSISRYINCTPAVHGPPVARSLFLPLDLLPRNPTRLCSPRPVRVLIDRSFFPAGLPDKRR